QRTSRCHCAIRKLRLRTHLYLRSLPVVTEQPLLREADRADQLALTLALALPRLMTVPAAVPLRSVIRRAVTLRPRASDWSVIPVWMLISAPSSGGSSGADPSGSV